MTISKLIKELQKFQKRSDRAKIVVFIPSLWTGNGTFNTADIESADLEAVNICDGDGFIESRKDGTERSCLSLVLRGHWSDEQTIKPLQPRMMNAAPELLEACAAALDIITGPNGMPYMTDTIAMLRAAIAKATGEAK